MNITEKMNRIRQIFGNEYDEYEFRKYQIKPL